MTAIATAGELFHRELNSGLYFFDSFHPGVDNEVVTVVLLLVLQELTPIDGNTYLAAGAPESSFSRPF